MFDSTAALDVSLSAVALHGCSAKSLRKLVHEAESHLGVLSFSMPFFSANHQLSCGS